MVKFLDKNSGINQWAANAQKNGKNKKSSNLFLWMMMFLLSWWIFSGWLAPKENVVGLTTAAPIENIKNVPIQKISDEKISANVQGLRISNIELKGYSADTKKDDGKNVALLAGDKEFIESGFLASGTVAPTSGSIWKNSAGSMVWKNADGIKFTRNISTDNYLITIKDEIKNNSRKDVSIAPYVRMVRSGEIDKKSGSVKTGAVSYVNSDLEIDGWKSLDKKSYAYQTVNGFVGFTDQYWETVASIGSPDQTILMKKISDSKYQVKSDAASINIAAGTTSVIETKIFAGPKEQKVLSGIEGKIPGISETIDYGWFWFLAQPMSSGLNVLNNFMGNYGIAIILLTIFLRLLMWPLTRKSFTSMAAMQKMQPEMARIQKLYKNDKARLQMEMMKLYQTHKASPMSGCLPMLLQIPIFFALYKALLISVPMRGAGFLWLSDLSVMDPYFILPLLMGGTMWLQQHLQTAAAAPAAGTAANNPAAQTQKFMKYMPVIFTLMFAWMPAGLVLYWTISNIFGIIQMYIIKNQK